MQTQTPAWWRQRRFVLAYAIAATVLGLFVCLGTFYTVSFGDQVLKTVDGFQSPVGALLGIGLIISFCFYGNNILGYTINDGPPVLATGLVLLAGFWLLYYCIYDPGFIDGLAQTEEFRALVESSIPRDEIAKLVKSKDNDGKLSELVDASVARAVKDLTVEMGWRYWVLLAANFNSLIAGLYLYLLHSEGNLDEPS